MQPSVNQKSVSGLVPTEVAGVNAAGPDPVTSETWTPVEGAWSQAAPWNDTSLRSRRVSILAGVGLGFLAVLAVGGALARQLGGLELGCSDGTDCNRLGVLLSQVESASPASGSSASSASGASAASADFPQAARLFQRACDLGYAGGCNNLGLAFEGGRGVPQDYERAFALFERACSGGFAEGCNNQGALYEHGLGVPANLGDAQRLYAQACRHGAALGCSNLGVLYAEGRGVVADPAQAEQLFSDACNAGSLVGCNNLFEAQHRITPVR